MDWSSFLSSGGGGGATYGNSGSSGVSTPVNTNQGGLGPSTFDFSNRAFAPQTNWVLIALIGLAAVIAVKKL